MLLWYSTSSLIISIYFILFSLLFFSPFLPTFPVSFPHFFPSISPNKNPPAAKCFSEKSTKCEMAFLKIHQLLSVQTAVGGFFDQALCSWWIFRISNRSWWIFILRGRLFLSLWAPSPHFSLHFSIRGGAVKCLFGAETPSVFLIFQSV